ncbi:SpoIIAA family protein [Niabella hibiscisoli]|uniref:STAS/SEC14 domain-containing protein n=1 Tax=Niabella hibiscisoli TaxID=1825928 RepID=UPI001F0ED65B|nr:STAS/SEC14 domain-containing protein [Niabella hibiscisoli]MCH5720943.1 STAS/SEC14 domain-containing protein [Niabella hibiscisoli]
MITEIKNISDTIVAFKASGTISGHDFETSLVPAIQQYKRQHKELNYMLVLEHDLSSFSINWWIKSLWLAIRDWSSWQRCAIISDLDGLKNFTNETCKDIPGELRIYPHEQIDDAIRWLQDDASQENDSTT